MIMNLQKIESLITSFYVDEEAVTSLEYAFIASLIAVVIVGAVSQSGANLSVMFGQISNCVTFAVTGAGSC